LSGGGTSVNASELEVHPPSELYATLDLGVTDPAQPAGAIGVLPTKRSARR